MKESISISRKRKKTKRVKIINRNILILFLIIFLVYAVLSSSVFCLSKIKINGIKQITPDEILRNVKIKPRKNIFLVKAGKIKNNLLLHPKIKSVEVSKKYPDMLEINIKERKPILTIKTKDKFVLVDGEGYITETLRNYSLYIPLVEGITLLETMPGKNVLSGKIKICKKILENQNKIYPHRVVKFYFDNSKITFTTSYNLNVRLGRIQDLKDIQEKMKRLRIVLENAQEEGRLLEYLDLSSKNDIIAGPKKI